MKKSEFKEMIKESVKEVLVEEGVLKNVISEVVKAVQENVSPPVARAKTFEEVQDFIKENKQKVVNKFVYTKVQIILIN